MKQNNQLDLGVISEYYEIKNGKLIPIAFVL